MDETLLFLHIPKTGGVTLSKILEEHYSRAQILTLDGQPLQVAKFKALAAAQRGRYRLIKGHLHFGLHRFIPGASTYVTFLRRPIERVLSFYYYARSTPDHYLYPLLATERLDLKTLFARGLTSELCNGQTRLLAGGDWEDSQRPVTRAALEQAKVNLRAHFRVVGLLEEFNASLLLLCHTFGWSLPFYLKENVTNERCNDKSLDVETRAVVEEANGFDLELYEYAGKLFNEQRRAAGSSFESELSDFDRLNGAYMCRRKTRAHVLPLRTRLLRTILTKMNSPISRTLRFGKACIGLS